MSYSFTEKKRIRKSFAKRESVQEVPYPALLEKLEAAKQIVRLKAEHPDALVLAHPECEAAVLQLADHVASTTGLLNYATQSPARAFIARHLRAEFLEHVAPLDADRTAAGLRDLKSLYVRANTCVACHQTVDSPLLKAGHPELTFELDGQSASQPRHWREGRAIILNSKRLFRLIHFQLPCSAAC